MSVVKSLDAMKVWIIALVCIVVGLAVGYHFGFNGAIAGTENGLAREFHDTKHQDEFAAAVALAAFSRIQRGQSDQAKHELATTVSIYYRAHRLDGNTNLIASIESYAATNAAMSNAIYKPVN
jgi:hypothetical protein